VTVGLLKEINNIPPPPSGLGPTPLVIVKPCTTELELSPLWK
jgi:hypothetical protein